MSLPTSEYNPEISPGTISLADADPRDVVRAAEDLTWQASPEYIAPTANTEQGYLPTQPESPDDPDIKAATYDAIDAAKPGAEQFEQQRDPLAVMQAISDNLQTLRAGVLGEENN